MAKSDHNRRRQFGTACLTGAVGMLVLGQTLLKSSLDGALFIFYWLTCFLLTCTTLLTSLFDAQAVRRQAQEQQRDLLQDALEKVNLPNQKESGSSATQNNLPD